MVRVKVTAVFTVATRAFGAPVKVGRLAFPVACTGAASGTRNSIPDSAKIGRAHV